MKHTNSITSHDIVIYRKTYEPTVILYTGHNRVPRVQHDADCVDEHQSATIFIESLVGVLYRR